MINLRNLNRFFLKNFTAHRDLSEKDSDENFLKANSDYSFFLLNNLNEYAFNLGNASNSGNFTPLFKMETLFVYN